jgi:hypothetical protein
MGGADGISSSGGGPSVLLLGVVAPAGGAHGQLPDFAAAKTGRLLDLLGGYAVGVGCQGRSACSHG